MTGRLAGCKAGPVQESRGPVRQLVVVRHAKAESSAPSDAERSLEPSGREDSLAGGRWLAGQGLRPDHALVSDARRARETWAGLAEGGGWDLTPEVSRLLYSAEPDTVLDLLREAPEDVTTVVVVGHNPTMATLASLLDDGTGDDATATELTAGGFPPCSLAVFEYAGAWSDLELTSATLTSFHVARA